MMISDFIFLLRNPHLRPTIWRRWLFWAGATAFGWMLAGATGLPVGRVVTVEGGAGVILTVSMNMGLLGALIGGLIGLGQWLFFRREFPFAVFWVLGTAAGWGLGLPAALVFNLLAGIGLSAALYGLIIGAFVGLSQWLVCRWIVNQPVRWIWINVLAVPTGILAAAVLDQAIFAATGVYWGWAWWQQAVSGGAAGLVSGGLSGMVMLVMWMNVPRNPSQVEENSHEA
jgi:hypothetical protein